MQETNFGVFKRDGLNFEVVALTKPILEWLACFRPKRRKPMQNDCQMFPGILARLSPGGFFRDFRKTNFGFSEMAMLDKAFSYCALSGWSGLHIMFNKTSSYSCCLVFSLKLSYAAMIISINCCLDFEKDTGNSVVPLLE